MNTSNDWGRVRFVRWARITQKQPFRLRQERSRSPAETKKEDFNKTGKCVNQLKLDKA
jgi:hypothetical protein